MNTIIRPAKKGDEAGLAQLMRQLGYAVDEHEVLERTNSIRKNQGEILVAETDGKVVGCASAIIDSRLAEGVTGEMASLVVCSEHRGLGIGKALALRAMDFLENRNCRNIRIRANSRREGAHDWYRRLGFTEVKTQTIFARDI